MALIVVFSALVAATVALETVHFDDLCSDDRPSVVFQAKSFGQCVCFSEGVYDVITNECQTTQFRTLYTSCALIHSVKSITKNHTADHRFLPVLSAYFSLCPQPLSTRVKRDAANNTVLDETDEDYIGSGVEIGQVLMRDQMELHIENVISKLVGLQQQKGRSVKDELSKSQYPVIKIMEYTKQIMQKTCAVVNPDFFDLALNSFVKLQVETYHIKEPYIGYSTFKRIEQAMSRCLQRAKPHVFVLPETNITGANSSEFLCDNKAMTTASNLTIIHAGTEAQETKEIYIPSYANYELEPGKIAEPLIETVWKMLVSTHSYCYMYFSDYFNDHHTYTVSLLPLFTNEIQDVWLNGHNGSRGYEIGDEKTKLYGGMFGNVIKIMQDVDWCTGASRSLSPYPWFMNRPSRDLSNTWNRKKRDVVDLEEEILEALGENRHQCGEPESMKKECPVKSL